MGFKTRRKVPRHSFVFILLGLVVIIVPESNGQYKYQNPVYSTISQGDVSIPNPVGSSGIDALNSGVLEGASNNVVVDLQRSAPIGNQQGWQGGQSMYYYEVYPKPGLKGKGKKCVGKKCKRRRDAGWGMEKEKPKGWGEPEQPKGWGEPEKPKGWGEPEKGGGWGEMETGGWGMESKGKGWGETSGGGWGEEEDDDDEGGGDLKGLTGLLGLLGLKGLKGLKLLKGPLAAAGLPLLPLLPILLPLLPLLPILLPLLLAIPAILGLGLLLLLPIPVICNGTTCFIGRSTDVGVGKTAFSSTSISRMVLDILNNEECVEKITCEMAKKGKSFKGGNWINRFAEYLPKENKFAARVKRGLQNAVKAEESSASREATTKGDSCSRFVCTSNALSAHKKNVVEHSEKQL